MLFDLKRCIGCHTCTIACKMENGIRLGSWIHVQTVGGPHSDTPNGKYPDVNMHYLPKICHHCRQPTCITACPADAIYKRRDGIVLIDKSKCNGCKACIEACPIGAPVFSPTEGVVSMCTLCSHRIDEGLDPFCVICCPTNAIEYGDIADPNSKVSQLVRKKKTWLPFDEIRTQPSIFYTSP